MSRGVLYGESTPCQLLRWSRTHRGRRASSSAAYRLAPGRREPRRRERALVAVGGNEVCVHTLVRQVEEERPRSVASLQPVERVVRQLVRDVALLRHLLAVDVQASRRRAVRALPGEADPAVEARLRPPIVVAHVPLPHQRRLVPRLLQVLREEYGASRDRRVVVHHLVLVGIQAGEDRRPARRTQRRRHERVSEVRALSSDAVHAGRLDDRMPHEAHGVVAVVVGEDEHHVARRGAGHPWERLHRRRRGLLAIGACERRRRDCQHGSQPHAGREMHAHVPPQKPKRPTR